MRKFPNLQYETTVCGSPCTTQLHGTQLYALVGNAWAFFFLNKIPLTVFNSISEEYQIHMYHARRLIVVFQFLSHQFLQTVDV